MWLIDKIKSWFKKSIECPIKNRNELVFMYVPKNRTIKLNTTLEVPKNYVAFIRAKDCLLDYFTEGTYKLSIFTLPRTVKKLKLNKVNKKGDIKDRFKADIFYVNLNKFNNVDFKSTNKIALEHKIYKGLCGSFVGVCDLSVSNPQTFLSSLFTEWAVIKGNMALEQTKIFISDSLSTMLNLKKVDYFEFEENNENLIADISSNVILKMNKLGLKIENLKIDKTIVSKKSLKRLLKENALHQNVDLKPATDANIDLVEQIEFDNEPDTIYNPHQIESAFAPHINNFNEQYNQKNFNQQDYQQFKNNQNDNNFNKSQQTEVAQNNQQSTQTKSTLDFAQCPNCGTYLSVNAKVCFSCGYDFESKSRCSNCGAKLHKGEIVCENCGQVNIKSEE